MRVLLIFNIDKLSVLLYYEWITGQELYFWFSGVLTHPLLIHQSQECSLWNSLHFYEDFKSSTSKYSKKFSLNQKGNRTKYYEKISRNVLKLSFWNLHRNVENFTRNILVIDGSTGDESKPLKIKNIILVQWFTHNKVVLKVCQYWISEEHALLDIIVSSSASSNICWLSDFSSSENWLDLPDPQSILSSSDSLFYIYDWYIH